MARVGFLAVAVVAFWWAHAGAAPDPYATSIILSDGQAGRATELTFSFRATGSTAEKVGMIEIGLAPGAKVDAEAFRRTCTVEGHGPKAGEVCARTFRDARIGHGTMTVEMLGMHAVTADAYRADGGPEGANLVFFFGPGQVFGVGAQSVFGSVTLGTDTPVRIRIMDIQKQLDLPFGATAELESGSFTFAGEPGKPALLNPTDGSVGDWTYDTTLSWDEGKQFQRVRAAAGK